MKSLFADQHRFPCFLCSSRGLFFQLQILIRGCKAPGKGIHNLRAKEKPALKTPGFPGIQDHFRDIAKSDPSVVSVIPTQIDTVVFTNNPFYQFFGGELTVNRPSTSFFGAPQQQTARPPAPGSAGGP